MATYNYDEMLKMQLHDNEHMPLLHTEDMSKKYYVYEIAELYHQKKCAENIEKPTKSAKPFIQGHRHKLFNAVQIQQINDLKNQGISNRKIAKIMRCDEKTIRNYLRREAEN